MIPQGYTILSKDKLYIRIFFPPFRLFTLLYYCTLVFGCGHDARRQDFQQPVFQWGVGMLQVQ